jgi:hypothetical protein
MTERRDSVCHEMGIVAKCILAKESALPCAGNYAAFIRYCLERLNKGDSVQAIWRDYQASAK